MFWPMHVEELPLEGCLKIRLGAFEDKRGMFVELYRREHFSRIGIPEDFVQDNLCSSRKGSLRGFHYQIGEALHGKLIRCHEGRVFDCGLDMRAQSPTFGQHILLELQDSLEWIWLPPGIAHGYLTVSDEAVMHYKLTYAYRPELERGVHPLDPFLGIAWPDMDFLLSDKDASLPSFEQAVKV